MPSRWRIIPAGLLGGVAGNGALGVLFSSPPVRKVLYDPALQSRLFIDVTSIRNIPLSVVGLVVLSVVHAWLFSVLSPSVPGRTWLRKGLFWGLTIWLMYWVFQEWFIYHTLLGEPWFLNLLELLLLLVGSLVEGVFISWTLKDGGGGRGARHSPLTEPVCR